MTLDERMKLDNTENIEKIAKQLEISNKLKLLEIAKEAGIITDEQYKDSIRNCHKVLF